MFEKIAMIAGIKDKIESATGQPLEHIFKCLGQAYDSMQKGPGLAHKKEEVAKKMKRIKECYDLAIATGLQPAQAFCLAGHYNGKDNTDIAVQFNTNFNPATPITEEAVGRIVSKIKPSFEPIALKNGFGEPSEFSCVVAPVDPAGCDWKDLV